MAVSFKKWAKEQDKLLKDKTIDQMSSEYCFRDPIRPIKNNSCLIYSPADGVIIDIKELKSVDEHLYTKNGEIRLDSLSSGLIKDGEYWALTIFLTFYDAHLVRVPVNGILNWIQLPALYSENKSMLEFEKMLFNYKYTNIRIEVVQSFAFNERTLVRIKNMDFEDEMFMIMTADYDIDTILPFCVGNNIPFHQNQRIASIRYGSMVTTIIPKSWNVSLVANEQTHVEAGVDVLFKFNR